MARVLVVCTGNVCRSPIAEGLLRAALEAKLGDQAPSVASAGTMGWVGSGADPASVEAGAERGVDISAHRARELRSDEVLAADLVLAMARDHEDALAALAPTRTFTLKQLVRLLEALPAPGPGDPDAMLTARIADADDLRRNGFEGYPLKEVLKSFLIQEGHEVLDLGTDSEEMVDYPDFCAAAGRAVVDGRADRGIVDRKSTRLNS